MSNTYSEEEQFKRLQQALNAKLLANRALLNAALAAKAKGAITIKAYPRGCGFDVQLNLTT